MVVDSYKFLQIPTVTYAFSCTNKTWLLSIRCEKSTMAERSLQAVAGPATSNVAENDPDVSNLPSNLSSSLIVFFFQLVRCR